MRHESHTPMVDEHMAEIVAKCREEWFKTAEGRQYKERYDRLHMEKERLYSEIDKKLHRYIAANYPT